MGLKRTYALLCNACGAKTASGYSTPRRARAAAKAVGWSRRTVVVQNVGYYWGKGGIKIYYDDKRGQDFCPRCTEAYLEEGARE